jgi:bacterioferritin (cytochrome b1)
MDINDPITNMFLAFNAANPPEQERNAFEQVVTQFFSHEKNEHKFLDEYREIVARHDNPLVKFLLQLIIADEEKHHNVVSTITSALHADLTGIKDHDADIPSLGAISEEKKEELLRLTAEFIEAEKQGINEYRTLIKNAEGFHRGLLVLLIRTIIHDSEKHLMILGFIDEKLREA